MLQAFTCINCFEVFWREDHCNYNDVNLNKLCDSCHAQQSSRRLDQFNKIENKLASSRSSSFRPSLSSNKTGVVVSFCGTNLKTTGRQSNVHAVPESEKGQIGVVKEDSSIARLPTPEKLSPVKIEFPGHQTIADKPIDGNSKRRKITNRKSPNKDSFRCVICDMDLTNRDLSSRTSHLKKCSKTTNISIKELLLMLRPQNLKYNNSNSCNCHLDGEEDFVDVSNDDKENSDLNLSINHKYSTTNTCIDEHDLNHALPDAQPLKRQRTDEKDGLNNSNSNSLAVNREAVVTKIVPLIKPKRKQWWSKRRSSNGKIWAPNYKKIQIQTMSQPIIVDGFQYACHQLSSCYFLTHFHSDHYIGLDSHFDAGTIYCSTVTAALVKLRLRVSADRIKPLELNELHVIIVGGETIQVTLVDANHCPGAVCILFEFRTGKKIFHTGDFRWNREYFLQNKTIQSLVYIEPNKAHKDIPNKVLDNKNLSVYLDTTYCNRNYDFPIQSLVIQEVLSVMRKEIESIDTLFLFGAYGIGKERVYMAVAEEFDRMIYVDSLRHKTMMCYNWEQSQKNRITMKASESNLWVVSMNKISFQTFESFLNQAGRGFKRIVAFQPTGWTHSSKSKIVNINMDSRNSSCDTLKNIVSVRTNKKGHKIYSVPYSEHSSFNELVDFVQIIRPHVIIPTVNTNVKSVQEQLNLLLGDSDGFV